MTTAPPIDRRRFLRRQAGHPAAWIAGALAMAVAGAMIALWWELATMGRPIWFIGSGAFLMVGAGLLAWLRRDIGQAAAQLAAQRIAAITDDMRFAYALIENNPDPTAILDAAGRVIAVNRAWERLLEQSRSNLIGEPLAEVLPDLAAALTSPRDLTRLADGMPRIFEGRVLRPKTLDLLVSEAAILTADGAIEAVITTLNDITQRKASASIEVNDREQLEIVLRATHAGIWDTNLVSGSTHFSARLKEIIGVASDVTLDHDAFFRDCLHPTDRLRVQEALEAHLADDTPFDQEYRVRHSDGRYVWIQVRAATLRGAGGAPLRFIGSVVDISKRKAAEHSLRSREQHYRQLVETSNSLIWALDVHGKLTFVNRRGALAVLGYEPEEMIGRHFNDFGAGKDRNRDALAYDEILQSRGLSTAVTRWRHRDGRLVFLSINIAVTRDVAGRVLGTLGTATDITEQVARERALAEANRRALAAAQAKAEFLATMSHEIRTPLNGVIATTSLLMETNLSSEQQDFTETIRSSGESLLAVINDILDFSKIESGKLSLEHTAYALGRVLDETLEILGDRARAKGLELVYRVAPGVPATLIGDMVRTRQILLNLASNAVKFTERGAVVISVRIVDRANDDGVLELSVADTGIGIAADKLPNLFEAFTQADSSMTRRFGGTGLGLAISKRLAELMGGTIHAQSEEGVGSTFRCTLRVGLDAAANVPELLEAAVDEATPLMGRSVMIVDGSDASRGALAEWASRWRMTVMEAADYTVALQALSSGALPDVILVASDQRVGAVDVFSHRLRELPGAGRLPIVLMSAQTRRALGRATEDIFAAVLLKPTKPRAVASAVVRAIATARVEERPAAAAYRTPIVAPVAGNVSFEGLPVLLVEDHEVNQRLATRMLEKLGCRVACADNGREALDRVREAAYAVVFMDVQMPVMDGLAATQAIHAMNLGDGRPRIVAMTANALPEDRARCLAAGMDDFLTKPLSRDPLIQTLRRWCGPITAAESLPAEPNAAILPAAADVHISDALDARRVRELLGDDETTLRHFDELVDLFARSAERQAQAARNAVVGRDIAALAAIAHALKGASINLGALRVARVARSIESAAKSGDGIPEMSLIDALADATDEAVEHLRAASRQHRAQVPASV